MDDQIPFLDTTGTQFDTTNCKNLKEWSQSQTTPWILGVRGVRKCYGKDIPQHLLQPFTNQVEYRSYLITPDHVLNYKEQNAKAELLEITEPAHPQVSHGVLISLSVQQSNISLVNHEHEDKGKALAVTGQEVAFNGMIRIHTPGIYLLKWK